MTQGTTTPESTGIRTAERLLVDLRDEIGRADTKASILIAAMGMSSGALVSLMAGADGWRPGHLSGIGASAWWVGCAGWTAALLSLLLAILPRYQRRSWSADGTVTHFQDIRVAALAGELSEALLRTDRDPLPALVDALSSNSKIVAAKHRWIRTGLAFFGAGVLALALAAVMG
ncbi:Pycsar system effector family protein [Kitasatospora sp. NPDC004799]|uniref:Pycsar system effector family protein n=1 Tax=Kitasatospora sp. NPDC004799 TaxID=3154460 RepID=UPI0033A62193